MSFRFAFIADTHLILPESGETPVGGRTAVGESFYRALIRDINSAKVDFIIHGGDIACGGHGFDASEEVFADSMQRAKTLEAEFEAPVHYVCGNHDVDPVSGSKQLFLEDFCPGGQSYRSFAVEKCRFILLDSQDLPEDRVYGCVGQLQLEWLESQLHIAKQEHQNVFVISHHPPALSPEGLGQGCSVDNPQELLDMLFKNHVEAVFSGHLHVNRAWNQNGVWFIWTAAIDSHPCSWRRVTVEEHVVTIETVNLSLTDEMALFAKSNLDHALREQQSGTDRDRQLTIDLGGDTAIVTEGAT